MLDLSVSSEKSLASVLKYDPSRNSFEVVNARKRSSPRPPRVVGHRGSMYHEPENTVASFRAAGEAGAEAVELDVFLLKCGRIAVFHGDGGDRLPGGLKRYCDVDGSIMDRTAEEARDLTFSTKPGNAFFCPDDRLADAEIPMLDEVLEHAKETGIELKIELKGPKVEGPVLDLVDRMDMADQCTFSSFSHDRIENVRRLRPQKNSDGSPVYRTGALFSDCPPDDFVERARQVGATEVHLRYDTCTKERVDAIHEAGMDSMAWWCGPTTMEKHLAEKYLDVSDEDETMYEMVMQSGVQSMCVNRPDRLVRMVSNLEDDSASDSD